MAKVLLAHSDEKIGASLAEALSAAGYHVTIARTFAAARDALSTHSFDVLIADVRLGPFNGIHLGVNARTLGAPRMIVTHHTHDLVLQREAMRLGAAFVPNAEKNLKLLLEAVRQLCPPGMPYRVNRKWPRLRVESPLPAIAASHEAKILDVSYSGIRLQFDRSEHLPPAFAIDLPQTDLHLDVSRVWTIEGHPLSCGVELLGDLNSRWWTFVDSIAR